jgi:hypothetical protein
VSQRGSHEFSEFVENVRWSHQGIVFATVNLPGSKNAREAFPGRTSAHDQASQRRTDAATAWLREAFAHAQATGAAAVVVNFHADPGLEAPVTNEYRRAYEPFLTALEEESDQFGRPVLVTHGDNHEFKIDTPLVGRTAGRRLERLTRLEVPGSPDVGWVRVVVTPGSTPTFAFEPRIVPRWKHW